MSALAWKRGTGPSVMVMRGPEAIRVLLVSEPASVATARAEAVRCARHAGMAPEAIDRVRLAVSEAVTNAVLHAYPRGGGSVELMVDAVPGSVHVEVADTGCGRAGADPSTASGGFGLALMRVLSDDLRIDDTPPGTRLMLDFTGRGRGARGGQ